MRWLSLLLCLCSLDAFAQQPSSSPVMGAANVRVAVDLSDGSRVVGTPVVSSLKMTTDYANLVIPLSKLREIEFTGTNPVANATLVNGDVLHASLIANGISLKTIFGSVEIPISYIRSIKQWMNGAATQMPQGLVLHYTFDADEGGHVTDVSGNGNDGELKGGVYTNDGKAGGAIRFNGREQAVIIKNSASLQLEDFTIMAWIKRDSPDRVSIIGNGYGELFCYGRDGYGLCLSPDGQIIMGKVWGPVVSSVTVSDQSFHHVAVTKQGARIMFYLDGVAHPAPDFDPGFEFKTNVAVGGLPDSLEDTFLGVIGEVAVFNRALSEQEVADIYNSHK